MIFRLCEEIWLQAYHDPPGFVRLPISGAPVDSGMPSPVVMQPKESGRPVVPPTAEEASRGIKGWSVDRDGALQPFYEGETEAPQSIVEQMAGARSARRG